MKRKRTRWKNILAVILVLLFFQPITTRADIGPKPSIHVRFENMGESLCYGTLLSKSDSTGPASAWDGTEANARYNEKEEYGYKELNYEVWKAFVEYEDEDGYYFLQEGWQVSDMKELAWTYYPPNPFKILLYYPEEGRFVVSGICERYAFDSYYVVDLSEQKENGELSVSGNENTTIVVEKNYNYSNEIISLVARIIATIAVEVVIALLFGLRSKRELQIVMIVNMITQILLNLLLNLVNYQAGQMAFVIVYFLLEVLVFIVESGIYCRRLPKAVEHPRKKSYYIMYAFVANAVSYGVGFEIAKILPGIF